MPLHISTSLSFIGSVNALSPSIAKKTWSQLEKFFSNPEHPSFKLERIQKGSEGMWSARINDGYRMILHKEGEAVRFLYAGNHDEAYQWAEKRKISVHEKTGGLQIVVLQEVLADKIQKIVQKEEHHPKTPLLFSHVEDDYLLSIGVPQEHLQWIRQFSTEDQLLKAEEEFSPDIHQKLMQIVDGRLPAPLIKKVDLKVEDQPATLEVFHTIKSESDLAPLLEQPFATWLIFLHPSQHKIAYGDFNGPIKVSGSAGTGKTVAAVHRAAHLAKSGKQILLCTYTKVLATNLKSQIELLLHTDEESKKRITTSTLHAAAYRLCQEAGMNLKAISPKDLNALFKNALEFGMDPAWAKLEWEHVIEHQGIETLKEYLLTSRTGMGKSIPESKRREVWPFFQSIFEYLSRNKLTTWGFFCGEASKLLKKKVVRTPYDSVIVDECQDLGFMETQLAGLLSPDAVCFFGDGGQRIYAKKASFQELGIDVRGRSYTLRINYRTSRQIRALADRIQSNEIEDIDGKTTTRKGVSSLLSGKEPVLQGFATQQEQTKAVVSAIQKYIKEGVEPEAIAVVGRTDDAIRSVSGALKEKGIIPFWPNSKSSNQTGVHMLTMHGTKGLEFRIVFVMGVSANQIPCPQSMKEIDDPKLNAEAMIRERNLLYVSMTRARDILHISWVNDPSPFLSPVL